MITAVCFLLTVLTVPLAGGKLERLGEIRLQKWWTIIASLVVQIGVISVFPGELGPTLAGALHVFSYLLALAFVWCNRSIVGMVVIVAGGTMNLAAIAANDGVMPARLEALRTAGIVADSDTFENSAPITDANLWFLGDVFAIPEGVPFANVFSVGDVLLVLGGAITVHTVCESRLAAPFRRRSDDDADMVSVGESLAATSSPTSLAPSPNAAPAPIGPDLLPAALAGDLPGRRAGTDRSTATTAAPGRPGATPSVDDLFATDHLPLAGTNGR